eukprot:RCo004501
MAVLPETRGFSVKDTDWQLREWHCSDDTICARQPTRAKRGEPQAKGEGKVGGCGEEQNVPEEKRFACPPHKSATPKKRVCGAPAADHKISLTASQPDSEKM